MAAVIDFWKEGELEEMMKHWDLYSKHWPGLFAFLIYTESDEALAQYIKDHLQDIHDMSGEDVLVLMLDKRDLPGEKPEEKGSLAKFLGSLKDDSEIKENDIPIPFSLREGIFDHSKSTVYEIAKLLDVEDKIPCLAFFYDFDINEIGVYKFKTPEEKGYKKEAKQFRDIFSFASKCRKKNETKEKIFRCMNRKLLMKKLTPTIKEVLKIILPIATKAITGGIGG